MALFDVFKKEKKKDAAQTPSGDSVGTRALSGGAEKEKETKTEALSKASNFVSGIFIKPHIAEKSTDLNEKGIYVFEIDKKTNKVMVKQAIKKNYGVIPRKVNIINIPPKKISFRGRKGTKKGFKKAVVCLKKGEKIELA